MMLRCTLENSVVLSAGIFLLLVLPMPAACQSEPVRAEEPPLLMEEVIVLGSKPLNGLKFEAYKAEDALYDIFNSLNTNDDLQVRCHREAPTGSHIKERVCYTKLQRKLLARASQRMILGDNYVYPTADIKLLNERLLTEMAKMALEQPEMRKALVRATEARQNLEAERKKRCEGRLLICR